jgi:hypothetical protein
MGPSMRRRLALHHRTALVGALALGALLGVTALATDAHAEGTKAAPCDTDPFFCATAGIAFDRVDALPIQWSFDTGWVPQGSPLQVHILAGVYANTHVALAGRLVTTWPEALTLEAPGNTGGAQLDYHYGTEFKAQGMVHVTIAGKTYSWTGDIPYVPRVDMQLEGAHPFDAWGYAPGATLARSTSPQKIASVGIANIIGPSIPGIDGGFELDAALEVAATYTTERMVIATPDGKPLDAGPITADEGQTRAAYASGPAVDLDVHPEGNVDYDGVLHLIPAFYIKLLGQHYQIPIADIPISFPITTTKWVFTPTRVHVPLPDLVVKEATLDLGEVPVGEESLASYSLWNAGEARVHALFASSAPAVFVPNDKALTLDPDLTVDSAIRFRPDHAGAFTGALTVTSNDPDAPVRVITLKGIGVGPAAPPAEDGPGSLEQDSGCSCSTAGHSGRGAPPTAIAVIAACGLARWSRRARARRGRPVTVCPGHPSTAR